MAIRILRNDDKKVNDEELTRLARCLSEAILKSDNTEQDLRLCYKSVLKDASDRGIKAVNIPLVTGREADYSTADALEIIADECSHFIHEVGMDITIVVAGRRSGAGKMLPDLKSYILRNYRKEGPVENESYGEGRLSRLNPFRKYFSDEKKSLSPSDSFGMNPSSTAGGVPYSAMAPQADSASFQESSRMKSFIMAPGMAQPKPRATQLKEDDELILASECIDSDHDEWQDELSDRIAHLADPFGKYVIYMMKRKGKTSVEVENEAWLSYKTFSKLNTHQDTYMPTKRTACQLCVGLGLNHDECRDLLGRAGLSLSPGILEDVIWEYFFERDPDDYDIFDISDALEENGLKPIVVLEEKKNKCI